MKKLKFMWTMSGILLFVLLMMMERGQSITAAPPTLNISGPDLVVSNVTFSPAAPQPGEPFDITMTVINEGDEPGIPQRAYLYIDPADAPPTETTLPVAQSGYGFPLSPGESYQYERLGQVMPDAGVYPVFVRVDVNGQTAESNEENNLFGPVLLNVGGDSDADGLPDLIELNGYDSNGDGIIDVDLPAMGADPNHKDIFVEIDYMVSPYLTYQPDPAAIQMIVDSFNNAPISNPDGTNGIRLHVDYGADAPLTWGAAATWGQLSGASELPHSEYVAECESTSVDWDQFDTIKQTHLQSARERLFHYNIWGDRLCDLRPGTIVASRNDTTSLATFKTGASDFIVTAGAWIDDPYIGTPTVNQLAGTFMHGLGLNLGLSHGGTDHHSYKPNHFSVMNPLFATNGIHLDGQWFNFDYSRYDTPTVDENALDETAGLTAPNSRIGKTIIICDEEGAVEVDIDQIDWNCDGDTTDTDVSRDINRSGKIGLLETQNEWERIVFTGGFIGNFNTDGGLIIYDDPAFNLPNLLDVAVVDNLPPFYEETRFDNAALTGQSIDIGRVVYLPYMRVGGDDSFEVETVTKYKGYTRFGVGGAVGELGSKNEYPRTYDVVPANRAVEGYAWNMHRSDSGIKVIRSCLEYREKVDWQTFHTHYKNIGNGKHICWDYDSGHLVKLLRADDSVCDGKPCIGKRDEAEAKFKELLKKRPNDIWLVGNEPDFVSQDALVETITVQGSDDPVHVGGAETYAQFYAYIYRLSQDAFRELSEAKPNAQKFSPRLGFCQAAVAGASSEFNGAGLPYCREAFGHLRSKLNEAGATFNHPADTIEVIAVHNYLFHGGKSNGSESWRLDSQNLETQYETRWREQMLEFECWAGTKRSCRLLNRDETSGEAGLADKPLWLTEFGVFNGWCYETHAPNAVTELNGGSRCQNTQRGYRYLGRNDDEGLWGLWSRQIRYLNDSSRWDAAWVFVSYSGEVTEGTTKCTVAGTIWVFENENGDRRCKDPDGLGNANQWLPNATNAGEIYKYVIDCVANFNCDNGNIAAALQVDLPYDLLRQIYPIQAVPYDPPCKDVEGTVGENECD